MESVRHLFVWLAVGTSHVAVVVSLLGHGSAPTTRGSETLLELVWSDPETVLTPVVLAPLPPLPVASAPVELPATVSRPDIRPSQAPTVESASAPGSSGETDAVKGEPPSFAERVEPAYPRAARLAGIEGVVRLRLEVTAAGALRRVEILASSGDAALDRAALRAAEASAYRPARVGGVAVDAVVEASYRFELR